MHRAFLSKTSVLLPAIVLVTLLNCPGVEAETVTLPELGWTAEQVNAATFDLAIEAEALEVAIDPFFIKPSLVTRGEYQTFLADNPQVSTPEYWDFYSSDPIHPVVGVNIQSILPFLRWMSSKDSEHTYRLPSEAELHAARTQGVIETSDPLIGDFTFDYFSNSFEEWDVDQIPIPDPFGPVFPVHGPKPAPNLVGVFPAPDKTAMRGPLAPDYTGTQFGFRYAFSPEGPGPLGARIMKQTAAQGAPGQTPEGIPEGGKVVDEMPESERVEVEVPTPLPPTPTSTATEVPKPTPAPPTVVTATRTDTPIPAMTPTDTATEMPTDTPTETATGTFTQTQLPTETPTFTPIPSPTQTHTPTMEQPTEVPTPSPEPPPLVAEYEDAPRFLPDQILPEVLVRGPGYQVTDEVSAEGMFYSFSVWTQYGWQRPESLSMLRIRISEVKALNALAELEKQPLFLQGVTDQIGGTLQATGNAVQQPIRTITDIPLGLQKFAGGLGRSITGQQEPEPSPRAIPNPKLHSRAKRELAIQLGVDPYTDNQALQNALEAVAANKNRGQLAAQIGSLFIPGGVGLALSAAQVNKTIQDRLVEMPPEEIRRKNVVDLLDLDCDSGLITSFMNNPVYTPTTHSIIVSSMVGMSEVKNIEQILKVIQRAPKPEIAHFYQTQLQMAYAYHLKVDRLDSIALLETTPVFFNSEGKMVVFLPVDFLYWNERIDQGMETLEDAFGVEGGQLWITGRTTKRSEANLLEEGIDVYDRALYKLWGN